MGESGMASFVELQLVPALQLCAEDRTSQDLTAIYSYLRGIDALQGVREATLRALCRSVQFTRQPANHILYSRDDPATCWYILLTGSVFIDGNMYLPRSSFGRRQPGYTRRLNECLVLEASDMIKIDYPDSGGGTMSPQTVLIDQHGLVHSPIDQTPMLDPRPDVLHGTDVCLRGSHASDTSSAYSGSDVLGRCSSTSSTHQPVLGEHVDLGDLQDSDEDDLESAESFPVQDSVRDVLEKDPPARTDDDIQILPDFMQHFPAFANLTLATKRELCAVMVFAMVEQPGTKVMNDGEMLDSWSVIINGEVETQLPDGTLQQLGVGDSFGVKPVAEKMYHSGVMTTKVPDCQFVCIAQEQYCSILNQGEENTQHVKENGKTVLVTELPATNTLTHGHKPQTPIVIKGTAEKLLEQLLADHGGSDATYTEDLLLTQRVFLPEPRPVSDRLLDWFRQPDLRDKVTRVVLLWVNNHFRDFENSPSLWEFLEKFQRLLFEARMTGQLRLLNIACSAKARARTVVLTRATSEQVLHFSVLGGIENNCGIYVAKVDKGSKAYIAGLKAGDQLLEVNGLNFEHITHEKALGVLRGTTHLSITVKSNLLAFTDIVHNPMPDGLEERARKHLSAHESKKLPLSIQRRSVPDLPGALLKPPAVHQEEEEKHKSKKQGGKLRKALAKFMPRSNTSSSGLSESQSDGSLVSSQHLSASNPDLHTGAGEGEAVLDQAVRVYRPDHTCKYLPVNRETTAGEVVILALREMGLPVEEADHFWLCEVSGMQGLLRTKRLPNYLTALADRIPLGGRYYIRTTTTAEPLVPDDMMSELQKEASVSLVNLKMAELATQLTLRDFEIFSSIEQTEFVDSLFELKTATGTERLERFEQLVNEEMFWVVTEICSESNALRRAKVVKLFIKLARLCKDYRNFNSLFAILSGLGHAAVSRLKATWDKLPAKYQRQFDDLQTIMDPTRNMHKYRSTISSASCQPPVIPFFPVVKKDLTFIHLGNDTHVDGLVNFDKMRMLAREIRHIANMASTRYSVDSMSEPCPVSVSAISGGYSTQYSSAVSGMATVRRRKKQQALPSAKKLFEECQMQKRVQSFLASRTIEQDEQKLMELSYKCEAQEKKEQMLSAPPPPSSLYSGPPKFGAHSPDQMRKLMALREAVRPYHPKHPLSPTGQPKAGSPRGKHSEVVPVSLNAESSSVRSGALAARLRTSAPTRPEPRDQRQPTAKHVHSSTCPIHGDRGVHRAESDSGHHSVSSTQLDAASLASSSSTDSQHSYHQRHVDQQRFIFPSHPSHQQHNPSQHSSHQHGSHQLIQSNQPTQRVYHQHQHPPSQPNTRHQQQPIYHQKLSHNGVGVAVDIQKPPPYHVAVQKSNTAAINQYLLQQMSSRQQRPLPDYRQAVQRTRRSANNSPAPIPVSTPLPALDPNFKGPYDPLHQPHRRAKSSERPRKVTQHHYGYRDH